jgi:predicted transport protein
MKDFKYERIEEISLKSHPTLNEKWVQDIIAEDPTILGLGDLTLRDRERLQPRAGRLDLLFQDSELSHRFEVEIQLGITDESHIIRTLEYWDIERRRYPQYEHTAVIVAENITSRFLNVISLFNGFIPLVAIQMKAIKLGDTVSLVFTKVLDQMTLGLVDEDEEQEATDRHYWETKRATKVTVAMADKLLDLVHDFDPDVQLNYVKHYIGVQKDGRSNNFVTFRPQKNSLRLGIRLPKSDETEKLIEDAGLDVINYSRWGVYQIRLAKSEIGAHKELLRDLMKQAYDTTGL